MAKIMYIMINLLNAVASVIYVI